MAVCRPSNPVSAPAVHRFWVMLAVTASLGALPGCSLLSQEAADPTLKMTPAELYADAKDEMSSGRYAEAIKVLGKLESRYPFGTWAQQAQLDTAYAFYRENDRTQALVAVERFIRLHPTSEQLPYAYYLKGLINFNEDLGLISRLGGQDLSERDQAAARESFDAFREVATRWPESKYTPDAIDRMAYLVNSMAAGEIHIARYYFQRGAYVAAASRAQDVVRQYQQSPAVEQALYIMMQSYKQLGLEQLRDDAERVLRQNFPNSELIRTGLPGDDRRWWQLWR